jgi:predicted transposase YdaD
MIVAHITMRFIQTYYREKHMIQKEKEKKKKIREEGRKEGRKEGNPLLLFPACTWRSGLGGD